MELVVAPVAALRAHVAHWFTDTVHGVLANAATTGNDSHRVTCGLSGGSTALLFLPALREAAVPWARIALYWGDERALPPHAPGSNFGLADQLLLQPLGTNAPTAYRMAGDAPDLAAAARDYAEALPPVLDLFVLGAGDDGHVCSLFPGHAALQQQSRVIVVTDAPKPPPRRLTLSLPYLLRVRHVALVAVGERKRAMLARAVRRAQGAHTARRARTDEPWTPVELVVAQARALTVFTDQQMSVQ